MLEQFSRTRLLIGEEALNQLQNSRVAVFGIGGVGGFVVEALARAGIGKFDLIDNDQVCLTNLNRQIIATRKTVGQDKVEVMKERILDINPDAEVTVHKCFFLPDTSNQFDFSNYSYVVDAIDTVTGKLEIITKSKQAGIPVISCMGTGNKIDPSRLEIADLYQTTVCPLAKVMRKECKRRNIKKLKVLYSTEVPIKPRTEENAENESAETPDKGRRAIPGSISFVPSAAGLMIAGEVVRDLIQWR